MATPTSTHRFQVTTPNGYVIACNDPEDLTKALVALERRDDAMSIRTPDTHPRVESQPADDTPVASVEGPDVDMVWTAALVKRLLKRTTPPGLKLLRAAVELGTGASAADLATQVGQDRAGGLGPTIAKIARDAHDIAPYLPVPIQTEGRRGTKTIVLDHTFCRAAKEVPI